MRTQRFRVTNATREAVLAVRLERATAFLARLKGLIGRPGLDPGEGLHLAPCNSLHTFFMRFPVDVVFLDRDRRVIGIRRSVKPWRAVICAKARSALELPAGTLQRTDTRAGDELDFELC